MVTMLRTKFPTPLGAAYTITPGLVLNVTYNDWSVKDNDFVNSDGSKTLLL